MDRFLQYTTGREPVITVNVVAALALGAVVLVLERLGIMLSEVELGMLGAAAFVAATWFAREGVFSPATYDQDVTEALYTPPPDED
jgi:hypothetical protein